MYVFYITTIHGLDVFPHWRSERVVGATPTAMCEEVLICIGAREQRELGYPEEVRVLGRGV